MPSAKPAPGFLGACVSFALFGLVQGNWNARIPALKAELGVSLDLLGLLLQAMGLGAITAMPLAGRLLRVCSARILHVVASVGSWVSLTAATRVTAPWEFAVAFAMVGAFWGTWDITLNVHGSLVEARSGRVIMPALHGAWGAGLLLGALCGSAFARLGASLAFHFSVLLPFVTLLDIAIGRSWDDPLRLSQRTSSRRDPRLVLVTVVIGLTMACATFAEGTASDWLALHVVQDLGGSPAEGGLAFAAFAALMMGGRLVGHVAIERLGRVRAVRISGSLVTLGVVITALAPGGLATAAAGACCWGLGLAIVFPAGITATRERAGDAAPGMIALASTLGYGGFLVAPPVVGILGSRIGLTHAFLAVAVLGLFIASLAPALRVKTSQSV